MKKLFLLSLALMLALTVFAGCGNNTAAESPAATAGESAPAGPDGETAAGAVLTGLGNDISIAKSAGATADADALAEIDTIMAAVTLDGTGKIVGVRIDMVQPKVTFDAAGQLTGDISQEIKTKVELGDAYGMAKASSIGKEWYQQIAALGQWMIGKTIDEVKALKTSRKDESHPAVPEDADLTSSVTLSVQDYIAAVEKAIANAG